jgi:hypothetical protein
MAVGAAMTTAVPSTRGAEVGETPTQAREAKSEATGAGAHRAVVGRCTRRREELALAPPTEMGWSRGDPPWECVPTCFGGADARPEHPERKLAEREGGRSIVSCFVSWLRR